MSKKLREEIKQRHLQELQVFLEATGFSTEQFDYHVRVYAYGNAYDFYPKGGKCFDLQTQQWERYDTLDDLYRITGR